ncbi:DUF4861 domain-containing protein [Hyunsoonleella pacifica]|uniref:DUF4861 domain-containing protein n=1 Tax=Hyunsoonleella pacifica TaxID=1080224 RepID=A0A4Q9FJH3_9FLAO|nr:DUF4861 domain-containing protein [Hyunsoonleella pacifica]TBN13092.1 DUF4861 domain-containing protein [Hyunsoonleella pacifica]GGD27203.1 hypothetical protein GCM10011368_31520 [Hyunsoonleella pacifica]
MKTLSISILLLSCFIFFNCENKSGQIITVKNSLDISRSFETVELNLSDIILSQGESIEGIGVVDVETGEVLVSQLVDEDLDGNIDILLFQVEIEANSEKQFELLQIEPSSKPKVEEYCYSRFVPERTDDYAWENNKVAFRTFGPVAQKMVENGVKGGTLSSGIDAWLKRVEFPIINKWYKRNDEKKGAYHEDHGEGLDNFHVGVSRGVGGIAAKIDTTYYVSKNFIKWKTITTGPIRTSFILEYADWDANGVAISEIKHISLDYGSNLSRFEVEISGIDNIYTGLTLHEKDGEATQNKEVGYISYWEPHGDSELGTAIVVPNGNMISTQLFETSVKDWSNLYTSVKVNEGKVVYYAGFGWKKAKTFTSKESWNNYLETFTQKVNNPLEVSLK